MAYLVTALNTWRMCSLSSLSLSCTSQRVWSLHSGIFLTDPVNYYYYHDYPHQQDILLSFPPPHSSTLYILAINIYHLQLYHIYLLFFLSCSLLFNFSSLFYLSCVPPPLRSPHSTLSTTIRFPVYPVETGLHYSSNINTAVIALSIFHMCSHAIKRTDPYGVFLGIWWW